MAQIYLMKHCYIVSYYGIKVSIYELSLKPNHTVKKKQNHTFTHEKQDLRPSASHTIKILVV
jgi:hypothetical protein